MVQIEDAAAPLQRRNSRVNLEGFTRQANLRSSDVLKRIVLGQTLVTSYL